MKRTKYRVLVTDAPTDTPNALTADAVDPVTPDAERFHVLIIVEDTWTGDGRLFTANSITWRNLPLPLMAKDTDEHGSFSADTKATLIGNIDTIERRGLELHGWGSYVTVDNPEGEAARLIGLVQRGEIRGVSADLDDIEVEVLIPVPAEPDGETEGEALDPFDDPYGSLPRETDEDGNEWMVLSGPEPRLRVTESRLMGCTVVPFPALQEAFIEHDGPPAAADDAPAEDAPADEPSTDEALVAAARPLLPRWNMNGLVLVAAGATLTPRRFDFPTFAPREWYETPEADEPTPLTITDAGHVYGHLAVWGECHVGLTHDCIEPPPSRCNYARFHVGEVPVEDGGRVSIGKLTFGTGHADTRLDAAATAAHYDNTGSIAAFVRASDGAHGIWVSGAMRSGLTDEQVRDVMAAPPSGDWRRFGGDLELVAALAVNVPGFNTPRARYRREDGLVASLIVRHQPGDDPCDQPPGSTTDGSADLSAVRERIAASIGRSTAQRKAELHARVHGGN